MEIEDEPVKVTGKDAPTDKKVKPKIDKKFETQMNEKQTYKKNSSYYE